jgi:hypothetical protein
MNGPHIDGAANPAVKLDRENLPHLVELFDYLGWLSPEKARWLQEINAELQAKLDQLTEPANAAAAAPEPPAEPINTDNDQLVGVQGLRWITTMLPSRGMTPAAALRHAAWLVAMADACEPGLADRFPAILRAVQNT